MSFTKEFLKHERRVEENFLGRPVPTRELKEFGKIFNKKDIRPKAINLAKERSIQIDKVKKNGSGVKLDE